MNALKLPAGRLAAYGILGFPLAMAALPIYVHVPKFYADTLGLSLAGVGLILLFARIFDAVQDPLLGWWSDARRLKPGGRWRFVAVGAPVMALGLYGLFNPPEWEAGALGWWLVANLLIVYTAYSMVTVSYTAIGAELSDDPVERTRVTAFREGAGLAGVFLAAALPEALKQSAGDRGAFAQFSLIFVPLVLAGAAIAIAWSPKPVSRPAVARTPLSAALTIPFANRDFRWLVAVFVLNGIAASIPATLVLFYIEDVVQRPELAAAFLIAYFAAGALGLPGWVWLSRRVGKVRAWLVSMGVSIVAFVWAFLLGPGDANAFFAICVLSGLGLGADLALPPALLADVIDQDEARGVGRNEGAYFGLWALTTKLNLALAAGLALPLLAAFGYEPSGENAARPLIVLAGVYALLPCLLKALAAVTLARSPLFSAPR